MTKEPKIGDLVFCKCVGSAAGWRINQLAVIIGHTICMDPPHVGRLFYDLYFSAGRGHVMRVPISDFEKGDIIKIGGSSFYIRK